MFWLFVGLSFYYVIYLGLLSFGILDMNLYNVKQPLFLAASNIWVNMVEFIFGVGGAVIAGVGAGGYGLTKMAQAKAHPEVVRQERKKQVAMAELDKKSNKIQLLTVHCTATKEGVDVTADQVRDWHMGSKAKGNRGWSKPGYHGLIRLDGKLESLVPYDSDEVLNNWEVSYGAKGFNRISLHFCLVGGLDSEGNNKDTFTSAQKQTLKKVDSESYKGSS